MNLKKLKNNKKGFTLIEIIVVVVILAVLMAVAVPAVMSYLNEADDAKYETAGRAVYTAVQTEWAKDYADGVLTADGKKVDIASVKTKAATRVKDDEDSIKVLTVTAINKQNGTACTGDDKSIGQVIATITIDGGESKTVTITGNKSVQVSKAS